MKRVVVLMLLWLSFLPFFGQSLKLMNTNITEEDKISKISEVSFTFDFTEAATAHNTDVSELGIAVAMRDLSTYRLLVYSGDKNAEYVGSINDITNDCIVGYGFKSISKNGIEKGCHSVSIPLVNPIDLEEGKKYTIYVPKGVFQAGIPGTVYSDTKLNEPIIIEIEGAKGDDNSLKLVSWLPESETEISSLTNLNLEFSGNICVTDNATANITVSGASYAQSTQIKSEGNAVSILFDNVPLYKGKDYIVTIPQGSITSADGSQEMDAISLFYKGGAYNYMTTGRVAPNTKNPVSWFSTIEIPFNFPEGYNIGNPENVYLKLYEGSLDAEPESFLCEANTSSNLSANLWKFDLKPNTTYYAVLEKEQIFPARADDYRIKLKDTTNDDVVLEYTTPSDLETPAKITVSSSTPVGNAELKNIDNVTLNFAKYDFENTLYDVKQNADIKTAIFNDGTNATEIPVAYDDVNMTAKIAINRSLEPGKTYSLTIPANSFVPVGNDNLAAIAGNDEIHMSFIGKNDATYHVGYELSGVGSMRTIVKEGETVSFEANNSEDWRVSKVTLVIDGNEEELVAEGNTYTTPAIEDDATIEVEYEYAREIDYNFTTGVDMTEICPYDVVSEGENLIISGVQPGDAISIYTTGGLKVADLSAVPSGMDIVAVSIPTGQAYIILINGKSLKFLHQ